MRTILLCLFTTLSIQDMIEDTIAAGYGLQSHKVTTEDGYILTMHRIPYNKPESLAENITQKLVILLMHGMMGTSASFIDQGPNKKVAYDLADAGYDVWLGNARGNPYSRAHETFNPDDEKDKAAFFNFSWEEIAIYDIAAMVDYIIGATKVKRITFMGDGHGGTSFLILNSLKPLYNKKFQVAHLLDPIGYNKYFPSAELKAAALNIDYLYALGQAAGIVEVSSVNLLKNETQEVTPLFALQSVVSYLANLGGFTPVGTSLKQLIHYGQNIRDKAFRCWDYGDTTNLKIYGKNNPLSYNLSRVSVYTTLYYHKSNAFIDERDVRDMAYDMPKAKASKLNETLDVKDLVDTARSSTVSLRKAKASKLNETALDVKDLVDTARSPTVSLRKAKASKLNETALDVKDLVDTARSSTVSLRKAKASKLNETALDVKDLVDTARSSTVSKNKIRHSVRYTNVAID